MVQQEVHGSIGDLLAATNEELKGKLRPAEICVDKETLVESARVQNKALIFIYENLNKLQSKLDSIEGNLSKQIDEVEVQINQWGSRVEHLERKTEVRPGRPSINKVSFLSTSLGTLLHA